MGRIWKWELKTEDTLEVIRDGCPLTGMLCVFFVHACSAPFLGGRGEKRWHEQRLEWKDLDAMCA